MDKFHKENYESADPLNKRNIDVARNYAYILETVKNEYSNKGIVFTAKSTKNFFELFFINSLDDSFYTEGFNFPFDILQGKEIYVLSPKTRKALIYQNEFFFPQNKREFSLLEQINNFYPERSIMESIYDSASHSILNTKEEVKDEIDAIYHYNANIHRHSIIDFSTFICFVNSYYKGYNPEFGTKINPENNKQSFFLKDKK